MVIIWIIVAILIFSTIVLVHEYWHFKTSRIFWVKVEEFWLWIPPRAKKIWTDKKWTLYSLNWLPLWWFVRLKWEVINKFDLYDENKIYLSNEILEWKIKKWSDIFTNNREKLNDKEKNEVLEKLLDNKSSDNLATKPIWQQSIIMLAGIFMNFILAIFIFSILFFIWVKPLWINSKIETNLDVKLIPTFEQAVKIWLIKKKLWVLLFPLAWSIAEKSWIINWDFIDKIILDNKELSINKPEDLMKIVKENSGKKITFIIGRKVKDCIKSKECLNYNYKKIIIIPWKDWKIGAYLSENIDINNNFVYKYGPIDSIKYGTIETYNQILLTFKWIKILWKNIFNPETPKQREEAIAQVSWPIWMVDFISKSISEWVIFLMVIWAILSINLWVFNLLPIPALDWWRFFLININWLIKAIFWKKAISENIEWLIHVFFFIILIALSLVIWYNDIAKLFN